MNDIYLSKKEIFGENAPLFFQKNINNNSNCLGFVPILPRYQFSWKVEYMYSSYLEFWFDLIKGVKIVIDRAQIGTNIYESLGWGSYSLTGLITFGGKISQMSVRTSRIPFLVLKHVDSSYAYQYRAIVYKLGYSVSIPSVLTL